MKNRAYIRSTHRYLFRWHTRDELKRSFFSFLLNIFIFDNFKNLCILHGHVFVMITRHLNKSLVIMLVNLKHVFSNALIFLLVPLCRGNPPSSGLVRILRASITKCGSPIPAMAWTKECENIIHV